MIDLAWAVARGAGFALVLQAAGAVLFVAAFAQLAPHAIAGVRRLAARAAAAGLLVIAAQYLLECARLGGELAGMLDPSLERLLLGSSVGVALGVRFAGLAAIAIGAPSERRSFSRLSLGGVLLAAGSFLVTGHTSISPERALLAPLLLVHLLILAFWFGSLLPLLRATRLESGPQAARLLAAFSGSAQWLVPLIALAGAAMATLLLPGLLALAEPYGLLLLAKLALFAALMGLAAFNRFRLLRGVERGEPAALGRLRTTMAAEFALILTAIAVTTVMTGFFSPS
ncbi:MAG TPA: CopD family protein [Steroidobacteraceae bacterium]|nr:CopD family protein [Steroidobacteraceae bacterium]